MYMYNIHIYIYIYRVYTEPTQDQGLDGRGPACGERGTRRRTVRPASEQLRQRRVCDSVPNTRPRRSVYHRISAIASQSCRFNLRRGPVRAAALNNESCRCIQILHADSCMYSTSILNIPSLQASLQFPISCSSQRPGQPEALTCGAKCTSRVVLDLPAARPPQWSHPSKYGGGP